MVTKKRAKGSKTFCQRITCQKETILGYLKSVKTHPTAGTVFLSVREKLPRISRATVYRILKKFKETNQIKEIMAGTNHYDGDLSPHSHFICQSCQKIFDVREGCRLIKQKRLKVGRIKNYQIYFYGDCQKCGKKNLP